MSTQMNPVPAVASPLARAEALSDKIMLAAGTFGVVCVFLPCVALGSFGSIAVARDWRGKICLLGYIAVAVLGYLLGRVADASTARQKAMAAVITAGVVLLMAVWLLISVSGTEMVSVAYGTYVNILTAAVLTAAAALKAKQAKLF